MLGTGVMLGTDLRLGCLPQYRPAEDIVHSAPNLISVSRGKSTDDAGRTVE